MKTALRNLLSTIFVFFIFGCGPSEQDRELPDQTGDPEIGLLKQAVNEIEKGPSLERRKAAISESTKPQEIQDPGDIKPPDGSKNYSFELDELKEVKLEQLRVKRQQPKAAGDKSEAPLKPDATIRLSFSSGVYEPEPGVDPRLIEAIEKNTERRFTYGFLYTDEYMNPEIKKELTEKGIRVLGVHSEVYKVKIPMDTEVIKNVMELGHVKWIGYPLPEQKIDRYLETVREKHGKALGGRLPVYISCFDPEFRKQEEDLMRKQGIILGEYDEDLSAYAAVLELEEIDWLTKQGYVLFIEMVPTGSGHHDESMSVMGVDYIRTGGGGTNFDGNTTILGIMDSGFMLGGAAATPHSDVNKNGCGINFTSDAAGVWNDQHDHGTHVLGTVIASGAGDSRNRGVATGIGSSGNRRIRAAKVLDSTNSFTSSWVQDGFDYMENATSCDNPRPQVINASLGTFAVGGNGTGILSRKLDANTWDHRQLYVISAGNSGNGASTIPSPGDAKNALTVGNVLKQGFQTTGDIFTDSSRGPTGDGRMKPNVVACGTSINSTNAGTANGYRSMTGTSMAAPHITGIAATVLQHYSIFTDRPHLMRAHLMASAILHDDDDTPRNNSSGGRNNYGLGRTDTYISHWARSGDGGWSGHWAARTITNSTWGYRDITVPAGTDRLVVVMTWDEDNASAGASKAVEYDLDLWVDRGADCTPDSKGQCGEWASQSWDDNVEYLIINNPVAGAYRLKIINWDAPSSGLPAAIAAVIIKGDPTPSLNVSANASDNTPALNTNFTITTSVNPTGYVASATHTEIQSMSPGIVFDDVSITREDGISMAFTDNNFSLGNIVWGDTRSATWTFRATSAGSKDITFRIWSENGGTVTRTVNVNAS